MVTQFNLDINLYDVPWVPSGVTDEILEPIFSVTFSTSVSVLRGRRQEPVDPWTKEGQMIVLSLYLTNYLT